MLRRATDDEEDEMGFAGRRAAARARFLHSLLAMAASGGCGEPIDRESAGGLDQKRADGWTINKSWSLLGVVELMRAVR